MKRGFGFNFMDIRQSNVFIRMETTCGALLYELKEIWDEIGESESGRDNMLLEIEKECLQAYSRKVDQAYKCRAQLRQAIADAEAELAQIFSVLGERPTSFRQTDQKAVGLKEEINLIIPFLEEMRKQKGDRKKQFTELLDQISELSSEIHRSSSEFSKMTTVDETDLSLKRLEELNSHLLALHKEKSDRLKQLVDNLNSLNCLCLVLGMDFKEKLHDIHPTLNDSKGNKNISDDTMETLSIVIQNLREIKIGRLRKLQDLASTLLELWNLMDTPQDEQHMFHDVTSKIAASEDEITEPNCLSADSISYVETEVSRLEMLKSSKMKDLILKKRTELEEICRQTHLLLEAQSLNHFSGEAIDSGAIDLSYVLEQIEQQISEAKEVAFSRKDILERVEKWKAACEEECWLEEYSRDECRYNGGRGGHLNLKRAEKARILATKIPGMVETLTSKTRAWEKDAGKAFLYDGVQLLTMLEDYSTLRQEKEKERQRQRDQKRLQGRLLAEKEALFGSKPSPTKSTKKGPRYSIGGTAFNRRFSLSGSMSQKQTKKSERSDLRAHPIHNLANANQKSSLHQPQITGKRNIGTVGQVQKKQQTKPMNASEFGTPMSRKAFSPVSNTVNQSAATPEKRKLTPLETHSASKTPRSTPTKSMSEMKHVNGAATPYSKIASPVLVTPSSLSAKSATPFSVRVDEAANDGCFEYSFEERRAGFAIPSEKTVKSVLQF